MCASTDHCSHVLCPEKLQVTAPVTIHNAAIAAALGTRARSRVRRSRALFMVLQLTVELAYDALALAGSEELCRLQSQRKRSLHVSQQRPDIVLRGAYRPGHRERGQRVGQL